MKKKAYSLIELSMVIVIMAILLSGGLSLVTGSNYSKKIRITQERMIAINKTITEFLIANKRLPCPAALANGKKISASYGEEGSAAGSCTTNGGYVSSGFPNIVYGMLPVRALGLSSEMAEDGFGNKFAYMVDKNFTNGATFGTASAINNIVIRNRSGGVLQTITNNAIFVIISYGVNGFGAYGAGVSNISAQNSRSSDADELENDINNSSLTSFDNVIISDSSDSDIFDDIILYKTRNDIVANSKDASLVKCPALTTVNTDVSYGGTQIEWPMGSGDQIVIATTLCPTGFQKTVKYPTRRCGALGVWDSVVHACTS